MFNRVLLLAAVTGMAQGQVTFDRILHADKEPQNWLTYSGNLAGQRHNIAVDAGSALFVYALR